MSKKAAKPPGKQMQVYAADQDVQSLLDIRAHLLAQGVDLSNSQTWRVALQLVKRHIEQLPDVLMVARTVQATDERRRK